RVFASPIIPISSDSSEESVGSHVPRVILFGTIPTSILVIHVVPAEVPILPADPLVAPDVGAVSVISPTGVLDSVDYSSSFDPDPSVDSLPLAPELPMVSPFLCSNDSKADSDSEPAEERTERHESLTDHDSMVSRIAWKRISHCSLDRHSLPDYTSDSSSSSSSSDSSSNISLGSSIDSLSDSSSVHFLGCDASGQTHSGPSTRVASPRLVYPSIRTLRYSSFERLLDSSSPFGGPSRKRCRSPTTLVPSSTPILRSIAPTLANLLPPCKRFRDSNSLEDSRKEHMKIGIANAEAVVDLGIADEVRAPIEDGWELRLLLVILGRTSRSLRQRPIMTITRSDMTPEAIEELINQRVAEALASYEANHTTDLRELMKLMAEVYCPRTKIQKMESELWNLTMKNNNLAAYTQRFQELTMLCTKMVTEEEDQVEKFIGG
nr:hypothetical protein [Tanacetum cinerariifolium]